jgi:glutamate 5-kinase
MTHACLAAPTGRPLVHVARRVVVKVGTAVLAGAGGAVAPARVNAFVAALVALQQAGREVLLVSSGAVRLGVERLGLDGRPAEHAAARACAAVGQGRLMASYMQACEQLGVEAAQLLVTGADFAEPRLSELRATLAALLACRVLPVINENDAVSARAGGPDAARRRDGFRDNDGLAGLLAARMGAGLLLILTDVPGLLTADPRAGSTARLIPLVRRVTARHERAAGGPRLGRGGMRSKLEAARTATDAGCAVVVADGRDPGVIGRVCGGEAVGTLFLPRPPAGRRDG